MISFQLYRHKLNRSLRESRAFIRVVNHYTGMNSLVMTSQVVPYCEPLSTYLAMAILVIVSSLEGAAVHDDVPHQSSQVTQSQHREVVNYSPTLLGHTVPAERPQVAYQHPGHQVTQSQHRGRKLFTNTPRSHRSRTEVLESHQGHQVTQSQHRGYNTHQHPPVTQSQIS